MSLKAFPSQTSSVISAAASSRDVSLESSKAQGQRGARQGRGGSTGADEQCCCLRRSIKRWRCQSTSPHEQSGVKMLQNAAVGLRTPGVFPARPHPARQRWQSTAEPAAWTPARRDGAREQEPREGAELCGHPGPGGTGPPSRQCQQGRGGMRQARNRGASQQHKSDASEQGAGLGRTGAVWGAPRQGGTCAGPRRSPFPLAAQTSAKPCP